MNTDTIHRFAARHALDSLSDATIRRLYEGQYSIDKAHRFIDFLDRLENGLLNHPVITTNSYTNWFSATKLNDTAIRHFIVQFSVVCNQYLVAQILKMNNASTLREMRRSKEMLVNDLGVSDSAPFELLLQMATPLGLGFEQLGRRIHGTPCTLFFCDELIRLFSSNDYAVSQAAFHAFITWAASGFWNQLEQGLAKYKARKLIAIPLTFFRHQAAQAQTYHCEGKKALETYYFTDNIDETLFIEKGSEMLEGIHTFWKCLDNDRKRNH
ncbi:MAG: hypothetical protein P8Y45_15130 [Exilibacterium sp.]